jgi:MFS family permease
LLPLLLWLLGEHAGRRRAWAAGVERARNAADPGERGWLLREVLRDPRFYRLLPAVLLPPFVFTGLFIHQAQLVAAKGWTMEWFAFGFMLHSLTAIVATLLFGWLVDLRGGHRLVGYYLLPLALGLLALALGDQPWIALVFMLFAGVTGGAALTIVGALWAELYGTTHLGAIRSLIWALAVSTTAAASAVVGALLDAGIGVGAIAGGRGLLAVAASVLAWSGGRRASSRSRTA